MEEARGKGEEETAGAGTKASGFPGPDRGSGLDFMPQEKIRGPMSGGSSESRFWALACAAILAWILFHLGPLLACPGECYINLEALHGRPVGFLELDDTRLNTWILAWTQHALLQPGTPLFDANAFYPSRGALAGSEHLLGQAIIGLPLRIFSDNPVLIYGLVLVASYALLGFSSLLLVRWLTNSRSLALAAALVSMAMPWRMAELSHLQLLSASAFPLIFLLTLRLLLGQGSRRDAILLTVVLTLQLLSSYYLVYLITFCLAILCAVAIAMRGIDLASTTKLIPAALIPYGILGLVSIPYLERANRGELAVTFDPENPIPGDHLGNAIAMLMPRFDTLWQRNPGFEPAFFIPFSVLALALLAPIWLGSAAGSLPECRTSRVRVAVVALSLCCTLAFVMTLGSMLTLGEETFRLPAYWASLSLPGFANLRAPHRWAIIIGTLIPALAALGAAWLARLGSGLPFAKGRIHGGHGVLIGLGILLTINLPWTRLPTRPALDGAAAHRGLYAALSELPQGPVLEIPWHPDSMIRNSADSRYMLASTRHWRPLLNGFTAHLPAPYGLLNRISQNLPDPSAVERLAQLTGLRWIVVHWKQLPPGTRGTWERSAKAGLSEVYRDGQGAIFELPPGPQSGRMRDALLDDTPRARSLGGLPRTPLRLQRNAGAITALESVSLFRYLGIEGLRRPLRVQIENRSASTWPALDVQTEGLIQLRYAFSTLEDHVIESGLAPLDADVPPGLHWFHPVISAPTISGHHRLCVDLVQILGGEPHPLPLEAIEIEVDVSGIGADRNDSIQRLTVAYHEHQRRGRAAPSSRCVRERASSPGPDAG